MWEFVGKTQVKKFEKLIELHGGDYNTAMRAFAIRVANEVDARGVLDVLRHGVKDRGVLVDLALLPAGAYAGCRRAQGSTTRTCFRWGAATSFLGRRGP